MIATKLDMPRAAVTKPITVKVLNLPFGASARHESSGQSSSTTESKGTYSFRRYIKGREVVSYNPPSTSITFHGDNPFLENSDLSIEMFATAFVKERLNVVDACIKFRDIASSDFVKTAVVDQAHDGIPFRNARAVVSFDHCNKIKEFWSSFMKLDPAHIASSKPSISLDDAIRATENMLEGTVLKRKDSELIKYLGYLAKEDGSAVLTYALVVINAAISKRLRAFVDAHSGHIVSIEDWVFNASSRSITNFCP